MTASVHPFPSRASLEALPGIVHQAIAAARAGESVPVWYDRQPVQVAAVLDIAGMDGNNRVVAALFPKHADDIAELRDQLTWIDRLDPRTAWESAVTVLSDYNDGAPVYGDGADVAAESLAGELRADALITAALLASLLQERAS